MAYWTERVSARAALARALLARPERMAQGHLTAGELTAIAEAGERAAAADAVQQAQLATAAVARALRAEATARLRASERLLKDLLPAVVADLRRAGHDAEATFLARLTFARYRLREVAGAAQAAGEGDATDEVVRRVQRVEREDAAARARGLGALAAALLAPERQAVAAALEARGIDRARLTQLEADARAVAASTPNRLARAPATSEEHDAVATQTAAWKASQRLIRRAVPGDPELEQLLARSRVRGR